MSKALRLSLFIFCFWRLFAHVLSFLQASTKNFTSFSFFSSSFFLTYQQSDAWEDDVIPLQVQNVHLISILCKCMGCLIERQSLLHEKYALQFHAIPRNSSFCNCSQLLAIPRNSPQFSAILRNSSPISAIPRNSMHGILCSFFLNNLFLLIFCYSKLLWDQCPIWFILRVFKIISSKVRWNINLAWSHH